MKRTRILTTISLCIIPLIFGVMFADLAGTFTYSDIPFAAVFVLYAVFVIVQLTKSKATFGIALFLLIWMTFSYIPTGAGRVTERIGEWFYLFFIFGLIQYTYEVYRLRK